MKSHNRPLYKDILSLKENIQNRKKVFKFKNKKWEKFIEMYLRKFRWFWKSRAKDHHRYLVSLRPFKFSSYWKRYKNSKLELKKFRLTYGHLTFNNSKIYIASNKTLGSLKKSIESRLNNVLYECKFASSVKEADQLVLWKKVYVNERIVDAKSFLLRPGDIIKIHKNRLGFIWKNIKKWCREDAYTKKRYTWPFPPKHLIVNYKTLQIIFGITTQNSSNFNSLYDINEEKLLNSKYI